MISWMQRHKKWLVITIWISTIAFVGAGFVGWGSFDYGKQGGVVAVVGDREVSIEEYQQEYSNLYEQYANMFGSMFNQEMADKLNLKDVAFKQVVQKNLILSYADSLGLDVTDENIAKQLLKYEAFIKDGKFDKETYIKVLSQNRMTPIEFENSLKRNILLEKVQTIFNLNPSEVEVENLSKVLFLKDDISIKILNAKNIQVNPTTDELKKYWEKNKNSYLSEIKYEIQTLEIPVTKANPSIEDIKAHYNKFKIDFKKEDGKLKTLEEAKDEVISALSKKFTKTSALKKYLKIKKNEDSLDSKNIYEISKLPFSSENSDKIIKAKNGDLIKPFFEKNKYIIVKLVKKYEAVPLSFEKAEFSVKKDYIKAEREKKLNELANKELKTFVGTKITDINRESVDKIIGLNKQEAAQFLNSLFASINKEGIVNLGEKIVLYKILDSKFANYDKAKDEVAKTTLMNIQGQELMKNLVDKLSNIYEVQSSIEIKE